MRNLKILFLYFVLFFSQETWAEERVERLSYKVYWSGFKVGEISYTTRIDGDSFSILNKINSTGVARYAWKYSSVNKVNGVVNDSGFLPKEYHSKWWRKNEKQDIKLFFSDAGNVIEESLVPPEKVGKRPEVTAEFKKSVIDPVTAAIVSRETIRKEIEKDPVSRETFKIPSFDAKRRFDVVAQIRGYTTKHLNGEAQELLQVNIRREPIAGFRGKDLVEMEEENQNIDFYLDKNFVPVWAEAKAKVGRATIKLVSSSGSLH